MSELVLKFADGEYPFALKIKQIVELERLCGATFGEIFTRVTTAKYAVLDISETIRLGLIGGGLPPVRAKQIIDTYVDGCPFVGINDPSSPYMTALAVLQAQVLGLVALEADAGKQKAS